MVECSRTSPHKETATVTTDAKPIRLSGWALVLGASSGFGAATSLALARAGLHIFGVHLDRKSTLPNAERLAADIKALGRQARFFNVNAADEEKRAEVASEMERVLRERDEVGQVRVMLHSLAFGTLKLFVADPMKEAVTKAQMDMTLDVMAHSLIYWAQELVSRGLMGRGGRIYAMTSAGDARVRPTTAQCPPPRLLSNPISGSWRPSWLRTGSRPTPSVPASPIRRRSKRFRAATRSSKARAGAIQADASPRWKTSPRRSWSSPIRTPTG